MSNPNIFDKSKGITYTDWRMSKLLSEGNKIENCSDQIGCEIAQRFLNNKLPLSDRIKDYLRKLYINKIPRKVRMWLRVFFCKHKWVIPKHMLEDEGDWIYCKKCLKSKLL
jgi:hypothetical protein